jgi:hypothetical protein
MQRRLGLPISGKLNSQRNGALLSLMMVKSTRTLRHTSQNSNDKIL